MGQALAIKHTAEEYYRLERAAPRKSEFVHGEIIAMAGGTSRHSLIKTNLLGELRNRLKGRPCTPYDSDQRLRVKDTGLRTYPDAAVYCGPMEYDPEDNQAETATNPTAIFEVLSDSTEAYDRGAKAAHYRRIASLQAYVLVSQNMPFVEILQHIPGQGWQVSDAAGLDAVLRIPCLDIELSLAEIYDRVTWDGPGQSVVPLRVVE
ncbi:MAG: Uma2 family endonuclease [Prosthecobacter sp.]|uniref:Uma2 family endonuclease n=1 Tax=Prosthecobacter sp. TaxID=1965333 RepID=UPI003902CED2